MHVRFAQFEELDAAQRTEAARVLRDGFVHQPAWQGAGEAEAEVQTFFDDQDRWAIAALQGEALRGWVGVIETYDHGYEIHPLVVDPGFQRRGLGARLLAEMEARAKAEGALVLYLGADDAYGGTSLFGADLFPDVAGKIADLVETGGHASGFYRRQGYEVVGLLPDVNGFGKPDILMAKRI